MSVELIASAITAAIASGATSAAGDTAKKAVADAYEGFKSLLKRKFGSESPTVKAVDALEANPESKGQQMVVSENLARSPATTDPELVDRAKALLELIKTIPGGDQYIQINQTISGSGNAVTGYGGNASITHTFYGPNPPRDRNG
jgi:hypothetical protein